MVALRCTARLLARVGPPQEVTVSSTTVLGDWYAAPLGVNRQRYVLLISEHSRLPVLMAGRDLKHLARTPPTPWRRCSGGFVSPPCHTARD